MLTLYFINVITLFNFYFGILIILLPLKKLYFNKLFTIKMFIFLKKKNLFINSLSIKLVNKKNANILMFFKFFKKF